MNNDDLLFSPVGMALEEKEFLWELIVASSDGLYGHPDFEGLKNQFFEDLNAVGRIEFTNKAEIREKLYERG